jgi:class 3 adenylate cyclase
MNVALAEWLAGFGLDGCEKALAANGVDLDILADLTEPDLEKIGLSLGERKRLLRAAATLGQAVPFPAASAERRHLTVMFVDLAGSTEAAARLDPEDFHDLVSAHLSAISAAILRFGGFIARYQGDGALAYFGWPQAGDNDAQRAASAALAVVAEVAGMAVAPRLAVRIGVATGLVVVGDIIGEGMAREVVVAGETANLAARLQAAAPGGGTLVAAETRALLGGAFDLGPPVTLALKGFAQPIEAWPLVAEQHGGAASRPATTRILAREAELDWLAERWREAESGAVRVVVLTGEPGIGKTRVVESFATGLTAPHTLLWARAVQRHASSSLYPVAGLLRGLAGIAAADGAEACMTKLRALLTEAFGEERANGSRAALLAALLDLPADDTLLDRDPRQRKTALLETLGGLITANARARPLLLVVEDVHWADATTLELLGLLASRLASLPALLLLVARPEFTAAWPGVAVTARTLGPLPEAASAVLATRVAGKALPPEVVDEILHRGDGVPLFIEEVTRAVLESGCLEETAEGWRVTRPIAAINIPATLHDSLIARIDRLGWVKELCQAGAVIGRDFSPELLAVLSRAAPHQLEAGLALLTRSGLVAPSVGARGMQYSFRHALMQDAAYRGLLNSKRRELHGRVAAAMLGHFPEHARREPEVLAHHYTEARLHQDAAAWWQRAAERDLSRAANREASAHFHRALEALAQCPPGGARDIEELDIRRGLSTAQIGVFGYTGEDLQQNVEHALAISDRLDEPGRLLAPLASHFGLIYSRGEMAQALPLGVQILRIAERTRQRGQRMAAHRLLGMAMAGTGDFPGAEAQLHAALALARPEKDAARLNEEPIERSVGVLGYLSMVEHLLGKTDAALASDAKALERARALEHPGTRVHAETLHACLLVLRGEDAALADTAVSLAEAASLQGSRPARAVAETLAALAAARAPNAALFTAIQEGRDQLRAIGWNVLLAWTTYKQIELFLTHRMDAEAGALLDELSAILEPRGYGMFQAGCLLQRAELARRAGRANATDLLRRAAACAHTQGAAFWQRRAEQALTN